jgi:hypothetical protein
MRVLELAYLLAEQSAQAPKQLDLRSVLGGILVQEKDQVRTEKARWEAVTLLKPNDAQAEDLTFAMRLCKHVKSNAIVYVKDLVTVAVGAGQMSRVDSSRIAVSKAKDAGLSLKGSAVCSDAFFPFADGLVAAAEAGATCAIQPGGSARDAEVVAAANERGVAMLFAGIAALALSGAGWAADKDNAPDFSLQGYYRTRGYVLKDFYPDQEEAGKMMVHRLRLQPVLDFQGRAKFIMMADAMDDVVWGDNASLAATSVFAATLAVAAAALAVAAAAVAGASSEPSSFASAALASASNSTASLTATALVSTSRDQRSLVDELQQRGNIFSCFACSCIQHHSRKPSCRSEHCS